MIHALTYQIEDAFAALPEMQRLLEKHYDEVAVLQDKIPLDPDYDRYRMLHAAGALHLVTVRADGELVGYHLSIVSRHLHYKSTIVANDDLFFLKPEHRRGYTGVRLFKEVEKSLREKGVQVITSRAKRHVKVGYIQSTVGRILEALGFREFERTYIKWIGD